MVVNFQVAEKAHGSYRHIGILRWVMVFIFLWFGIQKFSEYAAEAIQPLIANSPFISWLGYFGTIGEARIIGTIELTTAAILIVGSRVRAASALGSAMASGTFALTSSFIFTTPGITQFRPTGFPIVSTLIEQFLIKDIALLAMCLVLLISSLGSDLPPPRDS